MNGSGNYQSGNQGWGSSNTYSNSVDNCEISVWDPSSVNKAKTNSYDTVATNPPISNISAASAQSSPWHESVPLNTTPLRINNAYDVPQTHTPPPLQYQAQQNNYSANSDIYYTPSGDGGAYPSTNPSYTQQQQIDQKYYEQSQAINQSSPYSQQSNYGQQQTQSDLYYQNQTATNPNNMSYPASDNYTNQSYRSDQFNNSSMSNTSSNPDSFFNARIANNQYQTSNPTNNSSYVPVNSTSIKNWTEFSNPLNDNEPSAADIVERVKQTPAEKQVVANAMSKPTTISKSALAMIHKDLQNASSHLQSVEALQKFKNLQLGIHQDNPTTITELSTQTKSVLSVSAAEFIPRSASPKLKGDQYISKVFEHIDIDDNDIRRLTSSPIPISYTKLPVSQSTLAKAEAKLSQELSLVQNHSLANGDLEKETFNKEVISEQHGFKSVVLNSSLYSNPLVGLDVRKSNLLDIKKQDSFASENKDELKRNYNNTSQEIRSQDIETVFQKKPLSPESDKLISISKFPCSEGQYKLQMLGFVSLQQLGYSLEENVPIKDKVVKIVPTQTDDETKNYVLDLVTQQINNLIYDPASFDSVIAPFVAELRSLQLSNDVVSLIVDQIYEACVVEANFRYLGSQVCDSLSRKNTGIPKFRSLLLTKAQKEFKGMSEALNGDQEAMERARGFTLFVAELYLSLYNEEKDGTLTRFFVLGRAMLDVVKTLVEHPIDDNIQCAVRVLKLTALCLEDTLKEDGKGSFAKFEIILDEIEKLVDESSKTELSKSTKNLIQGLVRLRGNNWGRVPLKETFPTAPPIPPYVPGSSPHQILDENYFMNEPVFFTPDGIQYTSADAAIPEFYDQYLSKYQQPYETNPAEQNYVQDFDENFDPFAEYDDQFDPQNLPEDDQAYAQWSEADHNNTGEDTRASGSPEDYDNELEDFLNKIPDNQK